MDAVLRNPFVRAQNSYKLRMVFGKGQSVLILYPRLSASAGFRFAKGQIRRTVVKQALGILVEIPGLLFENDYKIPANPLCQYQHGGLCIERIQQQDIKETTAVLITNLFQQPFSRCDLLLPCRHAQNCGQT